MGEFIISNSDVSNEKCLKPIILLNNSVFLQFSYCQKEVNAIEFVLKNVYTKFN